MRTLVKHRFLSILILSAIILVTAIGGYVFFATGEETPSSFDGQRALADVHFQTELGPRVPGSQAHREAVWEEILTTLHQILNKLETAAPPVGTNGSAPHPSDGQGRM